MSVRTPSGQHGVPRLATLIAVAGLLLSALAGCGGGQRSKQLYVVGMGTPSVASFHVSTDGALTDETFVGTGGTPTAVVVDPQHSYAFVANSAGTVQRGAIAQYVVNDTAIVANTTTISTSTGTSTANVTPAPAGVDPVAMAMAASGQWLFVANRLSNTISVYAVDRSTGALTEQAGDAPAHSSPYATLAGPVALAVSGNTLFVANNGAGMVSAFTFDQSTGVLTASGTPVAAGTSPTALDADPSGHFLYVADAGANAVLGFTIGVNQLTPMAAPFPTDVGPDALRVDGSGKFVYVANASAGNVSAYSIATGGGLSAVTGSPFAAGTAPSALSIESSGKFLFVANRGSNNISAFFIDASSGALTAVTGSPFAANVGSPVGMASAN